MSDWIDKAVQEIEEALENGDITAKEYNQELRGLEEEIARNNIERRCEDDYFL